MSNEPAFPVLEFNRETGQVLDQHLGMTLRDYFAAKAMQGLLAQSCGTALSSDSKCGAEYAYLMADAMLAEREKGNPK